MTLPDLCLWPHEVGALSLGEDWRWALLLPEQTSLWRRPVPAFRLHSGGHFIELTPRQEHLVAWLIGRFGLHLDRAARGYWLRARIFAQSAPART